MATASETIVRELLANRLGVAFQTERLPVDKWGFADEWAILANDAWLVVDVEAQQA